MTLRARRCLSLQIAAYPLAADEARRMLQANRLKSLPNGALAAPSHARVRIIRRSNSDAYPISSDRPVPDLPAGRFLHKMAIGPKHERWRRRPPASLQAGRRGATTGFAPPFMAQRWTCIDHRAAKPPLWLQGDPLARSAQSRQTEGRHTLAETVEPFFSVSGRAIDIAQKQRGESTYPKGRRRHRIKSPDTGCLTSIRLRELEWIGT